MPLFLCDSCHQTYVDYYPPDDSCMLCKKGLVRIVKNDQDKSESSNQSVRAT